MSKWDELSMAEKAEMIGVAVKNGITALPEIRAKYNEFAEGGSTDADLVDRIIKEEGFNTKPENIGDGKITLGSGLTAQKWHDLYKQRGNKWSNADNRRAVAEEVANRRRWAEKNIPNWDKLPDSSQKALLSYKYNYDFNRNNSPKLFDALEKGDLYEAARQMDATSKDSNFKKGLQARRQREQKWFLSDVASKPVVPTIPFEQPVSTVVFNPYAQQIESTRIAPIMIPDEDSYVTAHKLTEAEERKQKFQERMEALRNFNKLLQMTSLDNTAVPAFMPTTGNTFLDNIMGLSRAEGGKIHIKDSKKGTFTAAASRHGKSVQEFASQVLAHPENYSPAMVKKANFARNSKKWKHGLGGNLYGGTTQPTQQMVIIPDNTYVDKNQIFPIITRKKYDWEDAALNRANQVYSNYNEAKDDPLSLSNTLFRNGLRWVKDNIYEDFPSGVSNCTLSATQWIDPSMPVKGAASIHKEPEKYNYSSIDSLDIVPGNLIISKVPDKDSYHTMMVTGFAGQDSTVTFKGKNYPIKKGEPLMTYSRGGHDNSFIQRNIPLSVYTANSEGHTQNLFYRYNYPREVFLPEIIVKPNKKRK